MPNNEGIDELFDVRTAYYIGAFQHCIQVAQKLKINNNPALSLERDTYVFRAYVAQKKYGVIFDEISASSSDPILKSIRFYAAFLNNQNSEDALPSAVSSFENIFNQLSPSENLAWLPNVLLASCYYCSGDIDSALRTLSGVGSEALEVRALTIQCLLAIDRVDLARKEYKKMQDIDEDATLTQLAGAWVSLMMGGEKSQDAYYTFQDMADKTKSTSLLLNGMASAYLSQSKQDEADGTISEAQGVDENCPETLINAIKNRHLAGKGIKSGARFLSELKSGHQKHPYMQDYKEKEDLFDRLAGQYSNS